MPKTVTDSVSTVATKTVGPKARYIEVVNIDGAGIISFRVDGTASVAEADDTHVVPAVAGASLKVRWPGDQTSTCEVSVVCSVATKVHVAATDI